MKEDFNNDQDTLNRQLAIETRRPEKDIDYAKIRDLIDRGADVDKPFIFGATALIFAAFCGREKLVTALLEAGANPLVRDDHLGHTARMHAEEEGHEKIAALLREAEKKFLATPQPRPAKGGAPKY